jgi:hypothetical protein
VSTGAGAQKHWIESTSQEAVGRNRPAAPLIKAGVWLFTLPAILLLSWTPVSARTQSRPPLIVDGLSLPPRLVAAALEELNCIWSPYRVEVQAGDDRRPSGGPAVRIQVALIDSPPAPGEMSETLGAIVFHDNVPEQRIAIYPAALERLVARASLADRNYREWPKAMRDTILGRMLGRALAHELGHYLLRSCRHSAKGLMRSNIPLPELIGADRRGFVLSGEDRRRLDLLLDETPIASVSAGE